jgi:hypothetical protein
MVFVLMKEVKLIINVDDLDFRIRDVTFEANVFNRYAHLIELQIKTWKIFAMHIYVVCWIKQL